MQPASSRIHLAKAFGGFLAIYAACGAALYLAGVPARVAATSGLALLVTALPFLGLYILVPRLRRAGNIVYGIWAALFTLDNLARGFSMLRYGAESDSNLVIETLANIYLSDYIEYAIDLAPTLLAMTVVLPLIAWLVSRPLVAASRVAAARTEPLRAGMAIAAALLILVPIVAHSNPVIRRANPVTRWGEIVDSWIDQQRERAVLIALRAKARDRLPAWAPQLVADKAPATFVLVLGESSNRWDWSLYGYRRQTNPRLEAIADQLVVFADAVSSFGSTLREINRIMTTAQVGDEESWKSEPDVVMLARAAGYKVFWLTNQNDYVNRAMYGTQADVFREINKGQGWREDTSLDGGLLPLVAEALADPAPHKFIVLHTLGSHQNYELRYPADFARFNGVEDEVSRSLDDKWFWMKQVRATYDNSILYTDFIVSSLIDMVAKAPGKGRLLYVSDHAQDVGHLTEAWGHQLKLESGFTVPMILWSSDRSDFATRKAELEPRPYQTDRLDRTILALLGIRTAFDRPEDVVTDPAYKPWPRIIDGRPYVPGKSHVSPPDS